MSTSRSREAAAAGIRGRDAFFRYVLVGGLNTVLDFCLFTLLAVVLGLLPLVANVVSTLLTVCVSYLLNRGFVFRTQRTVQATVPKFVTVTLLSALVVQSAVIWAVLHVGGSVAPGLAADVLVPFAKTCAMGAGMASNYLGYRWLFGGY